MSRTTRLLLALLASLGFVAVMAGPAHAGMNEKICNSSQSTYSTTIRVYRNNLWVTVQRGACSAGYAQRFVSYTGDCYSPWGARYDKGVIYDYRGTGSLTLRCYIT